MKLNRPTLAFVLAVLTVLSAALTPALVERMPLERLVREADLIVAARVLTVESRWVDEGAGGRTIRTMVSLAPGRVLKGTAPSRLTLDLPGGTVGDTTLTVTDLPAFRDGDEAVLFLHREDGHLGLVGAFQGKFPVRGGRVLVEGVPVDAVRFQDAVERFGRDASIDLYGALLLDLPRAGASGPVSPSEAARLAKPAAAFEPPGRAVTANLVMVQWDYEVDYDSDGHVQFGKLFWDVDTKGGSGPIQVYDKVFWRLTGTTAWSLLYTTPVYTITGAESTDARTLALYAGPRHDYDFRIETWQPGAAAADDFADPTTNEWACIAYQMEPPAEDAGGSGPVIVEIQPEKASAGTGTVAYIRGMGLGDGSGNSKVEFYFEGRDRIAVLPQAALEWSDSVVRVKVPVGYVDGYPGSAATGPVTVTAANGSETPNYDYKISFGYGGNKWPGTSPDVAFYVNQVIADWTQALTNAATTWSGTGNINLYYNGEFSGPSTTNGKNEVSKANLEAGVIAVASYLSRNGNMIECDITFNTDYSFSTAATTPAGAYDVESIGLHEMGHWCGLRDLYGGGEDRDKVMYGYGGTGAGGMKRVPHPDDAAGIAWIYGLDAPPQADFAWFGGRPEVGTPLQFQDESALQPTAWWWDFGDGSTSSQQNPAHTFLFSGTFPVTLTVSNAFGSSTVTKSVIVHGRGIVPPVTTGQPYTYIVPAAAKASGAGGTNWRSDLVVYNPGGAEASVYAYFLQSGQDNAAAAGTELILPALRFVRVGDVVGSMFRGNNLAGAILLGSTQPLAITSRTYNDQGEDGTYGQFIPAAATGTLLKAGEEGVLLHLAKSAAYRTNFGLANAMGTTTAVSVAFYKADQTLLGTKSYTLDPFEHLQENFVLDSLTAAAVEDAYAVATSSTAGAAYTVYASVVDNRSSDPIFIPFQRKGDVQGQARQVVAAAARAKGGQGSNWRTDLRLYNPFPAQSVTLTYVAGGVSTPATLSIGQGELVSKNDILTSLFPSVSGDSSGALQVQSAQGLLITSRTYNDQGAAGTYGQFIPARASGDLVASGQVGLLLQLASTADYRCNVGFSEFTGQATQVQVKLYDANRTVLGFKTYTVPASGNFQIGNIFGDLGVTGEYTVAMAEVRVLSGGSVYAYASIVDNATGDAFFIPAQK